MKMDMTMIILAAALILPATYLLAGPASGSEVSRQYLPDSAITLQVRAALKQESALDISRVSVNTQAGRVRLGGTVDSEAQQARAEDIASRVTGVQEVRSHLRIRPASVVASN